MHVWNTVASIHSDHQNCISSRALPTNLPHGQRLRKTLEESVQTWQWEIHCQTEHFPLWCVAEGVLQRNAKKAVLRGWTTTQSCRRVDQIPGLPSARSATGKRKSSARSRWKNPRICCDGSRIGLGGHKISFLFMILDIQVAIIRMAAFISRDDVNQFMIPWSNHIPLLPSAASVSGAGTSILITWWQLGVEMQQTARIEVVFSKKKQDSLRFFNSKSC